MEIKMKKSIPLRKQMYEVMHMYFVAELLKHAIVPLHEETNKECY